MLWGIGITSTAIAGVLWILNRHKQKQLAERAEEIDHRDQVRLQMLDERVIELDLKLQYEEDESVREILRQLKDQALLEKRRIAAFASQPMNVRLALEACEEAAASCEHELELRSEHNISNSESD